MHVAVSIGFLGGPPLAAMANRAAKLRRIVAHGFVRAEHRLAGESRLTRSHTHMTRDAAVGDLKLRHHNLPEAHRERSGLGPGRGLDLTPVLEQVLLNRCRDEQGEHPQAGPEQQMLVSIHGFVPQVRITLRMMSCVVLVTLRMTNHLTRSVRNTSPQCAGQSAGDQ